MPQVTWSREPLITESIDTAGSMARGRASAAQQGAAAPLAACAPAPARGASRPAWGARADGGVGRGEDSAGRIDHEAVDLELVVSVERRRFLHVVELERSSPSQACPTGKVTGHERESVHVHISVGACALGADGAAGEARGGLLAGRRRLGRSTNTQSIHVFELVGHLYILLHARSSEAGVRAYTHGRGEVWKPGRYGSAPGVHACVHVHLYTGAW